MLIFLGLVLFRKFGLNLGTLPLMFWRPKELKPGEKADHTRPNVVAQFFVGLGVGAVVWQVLLSGYVSEEFSNNLTIDRPPFCEARGELGGPGVPEPNNDRGFPARFRWHPRAATSFGRYALSILWGFAVVGGGVALLWGGYELVSNRWQKNAGWKPFDPKKPLESARAEGNNRAKDKKVPEDPPAPATGVAWLRVFGLWSAARWLARRRGRPSAYLDRVGRIPWSPALPLGAIVGWAALALLTFGLFAPVRNPPALSVRAGTGLLRFGAIGGTDYRTSKIEAMTRSGDRGEQAKLLREAAQQTTYPPGEQKGLRWWLSPYVPLYGAFLFNFLLISITYLVLMLPLRLVVVSFSPAVGILYLLNALVAASLILISFSPLPIGLALLLLGGWVLINGRAYKMKFPHLERYYDRPVRLQDVYTDRVAEDARATHGSQSSPACPEPPFQDRAPAIPPEPEPIRLLPSDPIPRHTRPGGPKKPPVVLVCVSGGGSRAAAWTMKTLLAIEERFRTHDQIEFPYYVRLITGASGGMIAGGMYAASLAAPDKEVGVRRHPLCGGSDPERAVSALSAGMSADVLTPNVHTLVTRDLPSWLLPFHLGRTDRGGIIEKEWSTALHGQLDQTFGQLKEGEEAGWRPSLIFSPMLVEDGRQLLISNLDLGKLVRNRGTLLGERANLCTENPLGGDGRRLLSREGVEFFRLFPQARDFRLSTAVRMSASFPYVMPAVPLPTNPPRRVVDAGYYDNYGVGIAANWLFNHLDWVKEKASGVVIVQIRDGVSGESRRREQVTDAAPSVPEAGLQGVASPPLGLWNFRQTSHAFRNDSLLHLLEEHIRRLTESGADGHLVRQFPDDFFATVSFELRGGDEVSLNLNLTESELKTIDDAAAHADFGNQIDALREWWHKRATSPEAGGVVQ
ncbi:MAG TPA: patatin-like phospholipase family protein [Gemmata sp.]